MQIYNTELEFLNTFEQVWQAQGVDHNLLVAIKVGVQNADNDERDVKSHSDGSLNLRVKGWVIRNEDIPMIEAIGIAVTAATAALGPGGLVMMATISATTSFAALCWKAWCKGVSLTQKEIAVLGFLEIHGPMELDELAKKASSNMKDISADEIVKTVQSLTDVEFRDGKVVELVRRDASGRWRVNPI